MLNVHVCWFILFLYTKLTYIFWIKGGVFPLIQRLLRSIEEQLRIIGCRKHDNDSSKINVNLPEETRQMHSGLFEQKGEEIF